MTPKHIDWEGIFGVVFLVLIVAYIVWKTILVYG